MPEQDSNESLGEDSKASPPTDDENIQQDLDDTTSASQNARSVEQSASLDVGQETQESNNNTPPPTDTTIRQSANSADGPSFMEDSFTNQAAAAQQIRTQEVYEKAGVRGGTPFSATQERRNLPAGLLRTGNEHSNDPSSLEKNRTTGRPGAAQPGAVAIDMAGLSGNRGQRSMGDATQQLVDGNSGDGEDGLRPSTPPPPPPRTAAAFVPSTPNDNGDIEQSTSKESSGSHSPDAESRSRRQSRFRHRPSEETKEEEQSMNAQERAMIQQPEVMVAGLAAVPPPMEEEVDTVDDDIEANVNNTHATGSLEEHGDMPRAIEAELVTEENGMDAEAERKRLRTQAEQDAQERFLANAVTAEAKVIDEEEEKRLTQKWKRYTIILSAVVVLIVVIVVVVAVVLTQRSKPDDAGTACEAAVPITDLDGSSYEGDTERDGGSYDGFCEIGYEGGFGQWYSLTGKGSRIVASTCKTNMTSGADTQVLVFRESCDKLECVGGTDQLCGDHGAVVFNAQADAKYWVLVRGFRQSSVGNYTLTVESLGTNEDCESAIEVYPNSTELIGSTRGLSVNQDEPSCSSETTPVSPSAWYKMEGDGNVKCAAAKTGKVIGFPVTVSVFSGECGSLKCNEHDEGPSGIAWKSNIGTSYYLTVHGEAGNTAGDFILNVTDAPSNSICTEAIELVVGNKTNSTTANACPVDAPTCHGDSESESDDRQKEIPSGVWFKVTGNGNLMEISTCEVIEENADVTLSLYTTEDDCGTLQCASSVVEPCGANLNGKKISWWSAQGEKYRILVESVDAVTFGIELKDFPPLVPDTCTDAIDVKISDTSFEVGSTFGATSDNAAFPCLSQQEPGVFYAVTGNGGSMKASTCIEGTNQPTEITILTGGCDSLQCVQGVQSEKCDKERSLAAWQSIEGQKYIIHVAGNAADSGDHFALTVSNGTLGAENDFCFNAESLSMDQTLNGSTSNSTIDDVIPCQEETTSAGVWYMFTGQGNSVTASLCHDTTDFDTQLRVFTGDCTSLQCVSFNDDSCNTKSSVTWLAAADTVYFVLVSGFEDQTGNFAISIGLAEEEES